MCKYCDSKAKLKQRRIELCSQVIDVDKIEKMRHCAPLLGEPAATELLRLIRSHEALRELRTLDINIAREL